MNPDNQNNETQNPPVEAEEIKMPENSDATPLEETNNDSVINGPLLFTLAILLILILGGMYFWFSTLSTPETTPTPAVERPTAEQNNEPESTTAEAQTDAMLVTSPSDEIEAIEADIESTDLDNLDTELEAIDSELDSALQGI